MEYKPFLYVGLFCVFYAAFLKNEKEDWKTVRSIVTNVKINDTVLNNINGLEISEIQSNADVVSCNLKCIRGYLRFVDFPHFVKLV